MLIVYKASAGSGKTHTLTEEYLKLLFSPEHISQKCSDKIDYFKYILSITFTNKATVEIKQRIIDTIYKISIGKETVFFDNLLKYSGLDYDDLVRCAKSYLKAILHNYSYFNVSTIDSFFQKVLKSFIIDLNLPANYRIELDTERVAQEVLENFFEEIADDPLLFKWSKNRAVERIKMGYSWNIAQEIKEIINELFKEKNAAELLKNNSIEDLQQMEHIILWIKSKINELIKEFELIGQDIINFLESRNIKGRSQAASLLSYLRKVIQEKKIFTGNFKPTAKSVSTLFSYENLEIIELYPEIKSKIYKLIEFYNKKAPFLTTLILINDNIHSYGALKKLISLLQEIRYRDRILFITDVVVFLSQMLKNTNIPLVYERIGAIIKHLMIDEFQDTSLYQWRNFIPLIENTLAEGNTNLIVGDAKQSLYRWRNGDFRILLYDIQRHFPSFYQEKVLEKNWRSRKEIVEFNNKIFSILPKKLFNLYNSALDNTLKDDVISRAYRDVKQEPANSEGGYLQIVMYEKPKVGWKDIANEYLAMTLTSLFEDGYRPHDIAILVRRNSEASEIFDFITQKFPNLNIVSEQSLSLENSLSVRLIISVFHFLLQENISMDTNEFHTAAIYALYSQLQSKNLNLGDITESFLPQEFIQRIFELRNLPLYQLTEEIISIFHLNEYVDELPFLRSFLELVSDFIEENNDDLGLFLNYWKQRELNTHSVDLSEDIDAIKIMTIHKSKGLSFPIVIIPYLYWSLGFGSNPPLIWKNTEQINELKDYKFPVKLKSQAVNSYFSADYAEELLFNYMDALNILYVAFTRPIERLYAFVPYSKKAERSENLTTISDVLFRVLKENFELSPFYADLVYTSGQKSPKKEYHPASVEYFTLEKLPVYNWKEKISIHTNAPDFFLSKIKYIGEAINYGNIMHDILAQIRKPEEAQEVLEQFYTEGKIDITLKMKIATHLEKIFSNPTVRDWFSDKWIVKTEESILMQDGTTKRPDRVLISDQEIVVIDYKFGERHTDHIDQVKEYMRLISEIEVDKKITGYLYYANENRILKIQL